MIDDLELSSNFDDDSLSDISLEDNSKEVGQSTGMRGILGDYSLFLEIVINDDPLDHHTSC